MQHWPLFLASAIENKRDVRNWPIFGILIDPLCGQGYNLAAVENSAFMESIRGAADGFAVLCFLKTTR
jgi:hypothetical protein